MLDSHVYSLYGESCRGQVASPKTPAPLRPSVGFGTVNAWQCVEDSDLVDSILLPGASSTMSHPYASQAAVPLPPLGATGSRDVLGANLLRGIRSTLAPVPFTSSWSPPAQPVSCESAAWESFLIDCEKDTGTMNRIIDLDSLCATFNCGREETTPSDSSPSTSVATELPEQDVQETCCEACGRRDENQITCSGSCSSAAAVCIDCWQAEVSPKSSAAPLDRRALWLCAVCRKTELKKKQQASERPTLAKGGRKRKRAGRVQKGDNEPCRASKQRLVKCD